MAAKKRLARELQDLAGNPPAWCKVTPNEDDMFEFKVTLIGPEKTPYEGGKFVVAVSVPVEYPFKAPKLKFVTKIYHCNVKAADGSLCLGSIETQWSPETKIVDLLLALYQRLQDPDGEHALDAETGKAFSSSRSQYDKTAKEWTKKYAK